MFVGDQVRGSLPGRFGVTKPARCVTLATGLNPGRIEKAAGDGIGCLAMGGAAAPTPHNITSTPPDRTTCRMNWGMTLSFLACLWCSPLRVPARESRGRGQQFG